MSERDSRDLHKQRVRKLLAQDSEINDAQITEFRAQLERSLDSWEEKVKKARRRILIALVAYLAGMAVMWSYAVLWRATHSGAPLLHGTAPWFFYGPALVWILVAAITTAWLIALYALKYMPALNRARFDLQTSMMLELQQQIKQLHENLTRQDK